MLSFGIVIGAGLQVLRLLAGSRKLAMGDSGSRPTIVPTHQFAAVEAKFEPDDRALRSDIAVKHNLNSPVFLPQPVPSLMRFGRSFMRRPAWAAAPS
jgi:hypothetical protein